MKRPVTPTVIVAVFMLSLLGMAFNASAAAPAPPKDAFSVKQGVLMRGDSEFVAQGFMVPETNVLAPGKNVIEPALVKVAEVGGNTLCFDLAGLSADGKSLDPAEVAFVHAYAGMAKTQRMALAIRVLGNSTDPKFRKNAVRTVAKALNEPLALYIIDGPDAGTLARRFKRAAKGLVVVSPENGDISLVSKAPDSAPASAQMLLGEIPNLEFANVHFLLEGGEAAYKALDEVLARPEEKAPVTPDNAVLSEAERAEGFAAMFDGKTLNGWWVKGETKDAFHVSEDGFIEWRKQGGDALMSAKRYGNFVFRCEWKILPGGNSGVWFRAPRGARQSYIGFEMQMQGDNDAKEFDHSNTGSIYMVVPPKARPARMEGLWNTLEVVCDGPHIKAIMNGELVQDVNMDENEALKYRLRKGFISLTDHDCYVAFRNLRIKELP